LFDFIKRKNMKKGRWNGIDVADLDENGLEARAALPGFGPVVWAGQVHKCGPAWGTALNSASYGVYRNVCEVDTDCKILLQHPQSCMVFAMSSAESGPSCSPNHLRDWLEVFSGINKINF
jgi:hypothetical protein